MAYSAGVIARQEIPPKDLLASVADQLEEGVVGLDDPPRQCQKMMPMTLASTRLRMRSSLLFWDRLACASSVTSTAMPIQPMILLAPIP